MTNVTHMLRRQQEWQQQNPLARWRAHQVPVLPRSKLGGIIGYSPQVIAEWEAGRMIPRWAVFGKLSDVMGVPVEKLKLAWDAWIRERPFDRVKRANERPDATA